MTSGATTPTRMADPLAPPMLNSTAARKLAGVTRVILLLTFLILIATLWQVFGQG